MINFSDVPAFQIELGEVKKTVNESNSQKVNLYFYNVQSKDMATAYLKMCISKTEQTLVTWYDTRMMTTIQQTNVGPRILYPVLCNMWWQVYAIQTEIYQTEKRKVKIYTSGVSSVNEVYFGD